MVTDSDGDAENIAGLPILPATELCIHNVDIRHKKERKKLGEYHAQTSAIVEVGLLSVYRIFPNEAYDVRQHASEIGIRHQP
jgi:hypothetical protein